MTSEPERLAPGRSTRPRPATTGLGRGDAEGMRGRNGGVGDSLWSTIRHRWFDSAEWHLRLAGFHGRAGRTNSAEASYRKVLSRHPDRLNALLGLGRLLLRGRRYDEAVEVCQRAVAVEPEAATPAFQLARALHRNGQVERAVVQYLRVVARQPAHDKAIATLEQIAKRLVPADASAQGIEGATAAAEIGRQLVALWPGAQRARDAAWTIAVAISASATGLAPRAPQAALARFNAALDVAPDLPEALRGAAACFEQLGQFDSAVSALDRLIEINPQAVEPRLQRDRLRLVLDGSDGWMKPEAARARNDLEREAMLARARRLLEPEQAAPPVVSGPQAREALLARARRLVSGPAQASPASSEERANQASLDRLLQQARSAQNDGRLDEAEEIFLRVLDADEANARALLGLSRLYVRQRRWAEASPLLARLVSHQPASMEPRQMLARALLEEGRLDEAQRAYAALAALDPDNLSVWRSLGRIRGRLGDWTAAREAWSRVIEIDPEPLDTRLELASACHRAGDLDAARVELQRVLAREPDHVGALTQLARIDRNTNPEASFAGWSRLADLNPEAVEPRLQMARIHHQRQHLEEAEAGYRAILDRNPTHREALEALGQILEPRDPEEAIRMFARWSEMDPTAVDPWLTKGRFHARVGQPELAETAFRQALELAPSNIRVLTVSARFYSATGRLDEALALWTKLQELASGQVEPHLQIARILHVRRDPEAVPALLNVLKIDLQHQEALRRLAQVLGRQDAAAQSALEVWDQLAGVERDSVPSILLRARLLELTGRIPEAEIEYKLALALDGRSMIALGDYATFLGGQARWEEAVEVQRASLLIEPERADILLSLGQSFNRLDRLQDAMESYDRVLALDPNHTTALGYRGRVLRTLGQVDASIAAFRRVCDLDPRNIPAWRELIFYLAGAEREAEALAALDKAEVALGETPETWLALGSAAEAALFGERAIAYFERAIAARPDSAEVHAQLGLYYFRQGMLDGALHHLLDSRDIDPGDVRHLTPVNIETGKRLFETTRALRELGFDHVAMRRAPRTVGEVLIPERLFAHVKKIAETAVKPYKPVPRSIIAVSATLAPGGAERQLVNMLRGLSDAAFGLDLALFCISLSSRSRRDFFLPTLDGTGVDVVVPDPGATEDYLWDPEVAPFADVIRRFPPDMVGSIAFWLSEFRRRRPQVVHAWQDTTNLTAVVAALLAGVPRIVLCCRSVRPDNPRRRLRRFMKDAYRAVLDHPAVVLSNNSRAGANDYAEWLGIEPGRVEVVYNGIDFDRLDRGLDPEVTGRARRELGIPDGARVLGGVYRMSEEKRPLLWLDVAAAVARQDDSVHFVICGDGPMRDEMRNYAAELGIADRVHMPGAQSNIGAWYKMMDVVMLTSRHEGLPNVLLEAQSLGIPVVAPDVGGMSEVVEQGITGWTIRNADANGLAERVLHCLTDEAWRQAAVERAQRFVRDRFSVAAMLRRNLEVYGISAGAVGA